MSMDMRWTMDLLPAGTACEMYLNNSAGSVTWNKANEPTQTVPGGWVQNFTDASGRTYTVFGPSITAMGW